MLKRGELPVTKLSKEAKVNYKTLLKDLDILEKKNIVEIIRGEKAKIVRLNFSNPKVIILKSLFEELEDE